MSHRRVLLSEYRVRLGALHLGPASPRALLAPVRRMLLSPDYSEDRARGDLALLQLHRPVPLSSRVQPVCLPEPRAHLPPGTLCWVTGWGSLHPGGEAEVGHSGTGGEPGVPPSTPCQGIPPLTASPWDPLVTQTSSQSFSGATPPTHPWLPRSSLIFHKSHFFPQCHSQSGDLCRE